MYYNISQNPQKEYSIDTSGEHIFYFENISGDITFNINTENADVKIYGLYQGKSTDDDYSLTVSQIHHKPNSHSTTLIKSVLKNGSKIQINGLIRIEKEAKNSKALLTNKNLILDECSAAISIPQLEVLPHEVECTHAAVTSPLDTDQINYLVARGISREDAEILLIEGFIKEVNQNFN